MNRWKHRWKRAASLAGRPWCWRRGWLPAPRRRRAPPLAGEESSQLALENDGATTQLVVAEISHSPERTAALEEIAAKYMADFPQTRVEIVTVEDSQEALAMLEGGQADLVELSQQEQPRRGGAGPAGGLGTLPGRVGGALQPDHGGQGGAVLHGQRPGLPHAHHLEPGPGLLPQRLV